jgi:hypothetical protein
MDNSQKTPLARSLNRVAIARVNDAMELLGRALPCSIVSMDETNTIATVSFNVLSSFTLPNITIPVLTSQYLRLPLQPGDFGMTVAADVLLGGISGLGSGTAQLNIPPGNLQGLGFIPVGSSKFVSVDDKNKIILYGPNGFEIRDQGNNCSIVGDKNNVTITAKTTLTLQVGGKTVVINSSGITLDGILWETHEHVTGGVNSGPPVSP